MKTKKNEIDLKIVDGKQFPLNELVEKIINHILNYTLPFSKDLKKHKPVS